MPWLLKFILPAAVDFIFKAALTVLKDQVSNSKSKIDDKIVNVIDLEQDELKELILDKAKELKK